MSGPEHPFNLDDLVSYLLNEPATAEAEALEEHLFECPVCAAELESLDRLRSAVRRAVRAAAVAATVTGAFLDRAIADGLTLREYRLVPGTRVPCSAGPEDLVVVHLAADFAGAESLTLRIDFEDIESGTRTSLPERRVAADRGLGEVVLVLPGDQVRAYPRSIWSIVLEAEGGGEGPTTYGPFVMDHTP